MTSIRVGIGGWTYAPWRGTLYPAGLPHAGELAHASRQLSSIEINGTFHGPQKPESFRKWRDAVPDGFVFAVKAPRWITHRSALAESGPAVQKFLAGGVLELGDRLGPLLWQMPAARAFDPEALEALCAALPASHDGIRLRHAIEATHPSFVDERFVALLRRHGIAWTIVDAEKVPLHGDITADFCYLRLKRNELATPEGYAADSLDGWAARARAWADGRPVTDLPATTPQANPVARPCFIYFIGGDKVRAPDAARAMLKRLDAP